MMAPLLPSLLQQQLWQDELPQSVTLFNSLIFSLVIFFISVIFLHKFTTTTRGGPKLNLPPSPPKLPIIGNLHQIGTLPHRSFLALSKKYGPIMLMQLGYTPAIVITSAEIAKEMTRNHDIAFSNRPRSTAVEILCYGSQDVAFSPYDEYWRQARKVCVHQLLSLKRVQSFQNAREEEVALIIESLRCSCRSNGAAGSVVNLTEMMIAIANNIISRCVLGQKSNKEEEGDDGKKKMRELSKRIGVLGASVCYGDLFPCLGWIDVLITGLIPGLKKTFKDLDSFFDRVIEEHRILKSKDQDQDFVDILLQLRSDDLLDFVLTQDSLKAILLDMIVAATESSSTTMVWIMTELVRNPTTLKKAQAEVRRVVGKKSKVDESDINQMGYLKCVIKEALRLHCPLPLMVARETSAVSLKLGGYDIPPKTRVFVNTWAIQRDSKLWGDNAEEFIPERFENNPVDFKGKDFEFLPFGFGRRGCPGMSFGVAAIENVTANLLYWFDWALPHDITPETLDVSEGFFISAPKRVPLHVVPTLHFP